MKIAALHHCPPNRHDCRPRPRPAARLAAGLLLASCLLAAGGGSGEEGARPTAESLARAAAATPVNRLAGEASPYLQLNAHGLVEWYPWRDEAFARARTEAKPIFLSVGYSSCRRCLVMDREISSNPEIAALLNRRFINIKVDREERPDLDQIYLQASELLGGSAGGWPNSVFLTPDGKPFFAASSSEREDGSDPLEFAGVLHRVADHWQSKRAQLTERAERTTRALSSAGRVESPPPDSLDRDEMLREAVGHLSRRYPPVSRNGTPSAEVFPSPPSLNLLLTAYERGLRHQGLETLEPTLDAMAQSAIYDHVGGGFHRYATDPGESVSHFAKTLYHNAQLLGLYARAYGATGRPFYRRVAEEIAAYLEREMTHPQGGLYSAQGDRAKDREGAFYLWRAAEIEEALGAKTTAEWFSIYELAPVYRGSASDPGALRLRRPLEPALERLALARESELFDHFEAARRRLRARRDRRERPLRDEKVLAAWNGLAIRGLADAARLLQRPDYLRRAERAARFVLSRHMGPQGLHRSFVAGQQREGAVLDDYAFLADGLLALYSATGDHDWLAKACTLADSMLESYEGPEGKGFYLTPEAPDLIVRPPALGDGAQPSGSGVALGVLRELADRTGERRYARATERTLFALSAPLVRAPWANATALVAISRAQFGAPIPLARDEAGEPPPSQGRKPPDLPTGLDHVKVKLRKPPGESDVVVVQLQIEADWHVNANPASLAFLIPTSVSLLNGAPGQTIRVEYPPGTRFEPGFSFERIEVYQGQLELPVQLPADLPPGAQLGVTFQACDATTCLPPETVSLDLP